MKLISCMSLLLVLMLEIVMGMENIDYEKELALLIKSASKQLASQEKLILYGTGGSTYSEITTVSLSYYFEGDLDVKEARALMVRGSDLILNMINKNLKIRQYLHTFPFTLKNLKLSIMFQRKGDSWPPYGRVATVHIFKDGLRYTTNNPETDELETLYVETYEDALNEVKGERND